MDSRQYRLAKRMRWAGRVIGVLAAGFFLTMLIGSMTAVVLGEDTEPITPAGILLGILGLIALAGCIVAWWRERLAGILLVVTALGLGIHIGVFAGRNHLLVWSIIGLPYLVAAGLLFNSWWLLRKTA